MARLPGSAAREPGRGTWSPTSPWGLQHRAARRGVGRPGRTGREGRHQGRGPDVRRRSYAACVRDSEYVTEPRVLMPAAPPRPSSPPGPQSHRFRSAGGGGDLSPTLEQGGLGLVHTPTHLLGQWGRPSLVPPISLVCRPISLVCRPIYPSAATAAPPFPRTRDRVTARSANGKAPHRGREVGGVPSGLGRKSCPEARRRARGSRSARPLRLNRSSSVSAAPSVSLSGGDLRRPGENSRKGCRASTRAGGAWVPRAPGRSCQSDCGWGVRLGWGRGGSALATGLPGRTRGSTLGHGARFLRKGKCTSA